MEKLKGSILIIDDDDDVLLTTKVVLRKHFSNITVENNPTILNSILYDESFDVILLDMNFDVGATSGKEGLFLLDKIKSLSPNSNVVMMTAYGDIDLAVKSMKQGATDFIIKPWENKKLVATMIAAFRLAQSNKMISELTAKQNILSQDIDKPYKEIIGQSESIKEVFATIDKVAGTDANILILGENGTGKEMIARAIHRKSKQAGQIFVNVDVGAIAGNLFESELFGHIKGAFTDAKESRAGRFELASGGTLFLDEIGNIPIPLQSKLLSVIQNREVIRIGSNKPIPIDIRLICATNIPQSDLKDENRFRQDLLYRINTVEIKLPPLRKRIEDIPLLANHFLVMFSKKYGKKNLSMSKEAKNKLKKFHWPGNIRELQHVIERAVIMCDKKQLKPFDFLIQDEGMEVKGEVLKLEEMEKAAIINALKKNQGNLSNTAKSLGLGRTTLYRKMNKYGL